jgi:hypothetical protein
MQGCAHEFLAASLIICIKMSKSAVAVIIIAKIASSPSGSLSVAFWSFEKKSLIVLDSRVIREGREGRGGGKSLSLG